MNGYNLSRNWFDFCFKNPDKIKPVHTALYFFCIEHCNRLGWKEKFGLPTTMVKEAIGIHSYNTYINTLNELIEFGFIKLITKSQNQHSSNIIAISNFNKPNDKALDEPLDKALINHATKQRQSKGESDCSIDKQINKEPIKPITSKPVKQFIIPTLDEVKQFFLENGYNEAGAIKSFNHYAFNDWKNSKDKPVKNWKTTMSNNWFEEKYKVSLQSNKLQSLPESFWNKKQYPYLDDFLAKQSPEFFIEIPTDIKQYLHDKTFKCHLMKAPGCTEENYYEFHKIVK